tara:strand:- start:600 stop:710 length:111 start_codon:yes stop_codon:yes gene_type:complete
MIVKPVAEWHLSAMMGTNGGVEKYTIGEKHFQLKVK